MGRRLADATNACRMRCTRGDIRRLRFRAAVVFAVDFDFEFAVFADELDAFEELLRVEGAAAPSDCFPSACAESHKDPLAIPAATNRMSFREDNTPSFYRRKLGPITEISSS